jgi:hypothetical protein
LDSYAGRLRQHGDAFSAVRRAEEGLCAHGTRRKPQLARLSASLNLSLLHFSLW